MFGSRQTFKGHMEMDTINGITTLMRGLAAIGIMNVDPKAVKDQDVLTAITAV